MRITVPLEIQHENVRFHLYAEAEVSPPSHLYSDDRGGFGPLGCEVEIVAVTFDEAVITVGPSDELHFTEVDPLPGATWLEYVDKWFDAHETAFDEFCASAIEQAGEEDEAAAEAAMERNH